MAQDPVRRDLRLAVRWRVKGLSLTIRRVSVGLALVPALLSVANYQTRWIGEEQWPGRFVAICFALLFAVKLFIGPTVDEISAKRDSKRDLP